MNDHSPPSMSDEELIETYIELPKRRLRMAAVTLAQSNGMVIDEIERDAIDAINAEHALERLVLSLAWACDADAVREAWHGGLRQWFNREDYRLEMEVRRFVTQRQQALADAAARKDSVDAEPSTPR